MNTMVARKHAEQGFDDCLTLYLIQRAAAGPWRARAKGPAKRTSPRPHPIPELASSLVEGDIKKVRSV